jgi:hypothetical protein
MPEVFGFVCRLFGYASCGSISTFEALILAPITAGLVYVLGVLLVLALSFVWPSPSVRPSPSAQRPTYGWREVLGVLFVLACAALPVGIVLVAVWLR